MSFEPYSEDVVIPDRFTGEGYPTENFDLIKDGKLVSFVLSQYGANKTGGKRSGNGGSGMKVKSGEKSLEECVENLKRSTRRYAKRQLTWFRRDPSVHWFEIDRLSFEEILSAASELISKDCHYGKISNP